MKFKYQKVEREFESRMKELRRAYRKGDIYKAICYLRYLTCFYYTVNYKLADEELEEITKNVSHKFIGETVIKNVRERTVLFYDGFGLATRGLANIYAKALAELDYKVVWLLHERSSDIDEIKKKFREYKNISFDIIPGLKALERMKYLQKEILEISPQYIFLYTVPDDVIGIGAFSTVKGAMRFLIDLTDHAYWLGKCATDYAIGFRNIGYNIAVQYRKFDEDKVLLLPYYPDPREDFPFAGMPFDVEKYEYVFSGGSVYKIEGSDYYEKMVRFILDNYPKMKFVYAGDQKSDILDSLKYSYPDQFYQITERKDLDMVMKKAKFYLSTYPIGGGLMIQYAILNDCIPVTLYEKDNIPGNTITLLLQPEKARFGACSYDEICDLIGKLLNDKEFYQSVKGDLRDQVISEEDFKRQLDQIIKYQVSKYKGVPAKANIQEFLNIYKKRVNYEMFAKIVYQSRNKWVYRHHPIIYRQGKKGRLEKND